MGDMTATVLALAVRQLAEGSEGSAGDAGSSNFLLPNGTFFVVLIIFLIVLAVIGTFVVPPIMKVLRERENMVTRTFADNKESAEQFAAADADYEKKMSAARLDAATVRDDARAEGRKLIEDKRSAADAEVASTLQTANEQLKREGDDVAEELRARVETLSATLASRILGVAMDSVDSVDSVSGR